MLSAGLAIWLQIPHLTDVYPKNGAENISAGEPLRLVFSHPMDTNSVMAHLEIEPFLTGKSAWQGNTYIFQPDQPWQNNTTYHIRLTKGVRSNGWLKLTTKQDKNWSFTIVDPLLAYLYPATGISQVYTIDPANGEQNQITNVTGGIMDFCASQNGATLYYSLDLGANHSAIYRLDRASGKSTLMIDCPQALCQVPQVSPQNDYLAYERTPLSQSGQGGKTQVWIAALPVEGSVGKNDLPKPTLVADPDHQTQQPTWSSKGTLAYYDHTLSSYIIQTPEGSELARFPSETGQAGDWDAQGGSFTFPEFFISPQTSSSLSDLNPIPSSHLWRFFLDDNKPMDLTVMDYLEDSAPVFSPDGKWLVFARKYLDTVRWTPGRQIWILPLEGKEAYPITDEPLYNHYGFTWSPNSQLIAYIRFYQATMTDPPEIWVTNIDRSSQYLLVRNGYAPQWIP